MTSRHGFELGISAIVVMVLTVAAVVIAVNALAAQTATAESTVYAGSEGAGELANKTVNQAGNTTCLGQQGFCMPTGFAPPGGIDCAEDIYSLCGTTAYCCVTECRKYGGACNGDPTACAFENQLNLSCATSGSICCPRSYD